MSQTNPANIVVERENSSNHQNFIKYKLMKEKYNYERARNVSIVQALAKLGHFPQKESDKEAWFLSLFRSETQAS